MQPTARERDIERRITSKDYEQLARLRYVFEKYRSEDNESRLNDILELDGDINYQTPDTGNTALHFIENHNTRMAKQLIDRGADPTIANRKGQTVVHLAVGKFKNHLWRSSGCPYIRDMLSTIHIRNENKTNYTDVYGLSHFHVACMIDNTETVEFFLNNGVSVDEAVNMDSPEYPGYTSLLFAAEYGYVDLVDKLLDHGAKLIEDSRGMTPLHFLVGRNMEIVQHMSLYRIPVYDYPDIGIVQNEGTVLAEMGANEQMIRSIVSKRSETAMVEVDLFPFYVMRTLKDGSLNWTQSDINECIPVGSTFWPGYSALHFAARFDIDTVKLLLEKGADIETKDADGVTPFDLCVGRYGVEDIHFIISSHSTWRNILLSDGKTKLLDLVLAMRGPEELTKLLNEIQRSINGISIPRDSPLWPGFTVLHLAVTLSKKRMRARVKKYKALFANDPKRKPNELIEACLRLGADVLAKDGSGSTPTHLAFHRMDLDVMYQLIELYDGKSNPTNEDNLSLLHIACVLENENLVKQLLDSGADVNAAVSSTFQWDPEVRYFYELTSSDEHLHVWPGSTPLHAAVATTNAEISKLLLGAGANLNAQDAKGLTPVHRLLARRLYNNCVIDIMDYDDLLSRFVSKDCVVDGLSYLHVAAHYGFSKFVDKLLDLGADVNSTIAVARDRRPIKRGRWDVDLAASKRTTEFSYFFKFHEGNTPLHMLLVPMFYESEYHLAIAKALLSSGADVLAKNAEGQSPISEVLEDDLLILHYASLMSVDEEKRLVDETGLTKLHLACRVFDVKMMRKCLNKGAKVNARVRDDSKVWPGYTPLHVVAETCEAAFDKYWFAKKKMRGAVRLLLNNGADLMIANAKGETPLMLDIDEKYIETRSPYTDILWKKLKNIDVNPVSDEGISHFHLACIRNDVNSVKRFLKLGVDPNQTVDYYHDKFPGYTPLHFAVCARFILSDLPPLRTINLLLKYGANIDARDKKNETPLHLAGRFQTQGALPYKRLFWAGADPEAKNLGGGVPKNRMFNIEEGEVRRFFNDTVSEPCRNCRRIFFGLLNIFLRPFYRCTRCLRRNINKKRNRNTVKKIVICSQNK